MSKRTFFPLSLVLLLVLSLAVTFAACSQAAPAPKASSHKAGPVETWTRRPTIPLKTAEPGGADKDLQPLQGCISAYKKGSRHTAKQDHLDILMQGVQAWNRWRSKNPGIAPSLSGIDLRRRNLSGADLREADLSGARLVEVNLAESTLARANLCGAYVSESNLAEADLREARLTQATLSRVNLGGADLRGAELTGTKLSQVNLRGALLPEGFQAS